MCVHTHECTPVFKYVHACIRGECHSTPAEPGNNSPGVSSLLPLVGSRDGTQLLTLDINVFRVSTVVVASQIF